MKRSGPPARRTPLRAKAPLASAGAQPRRKRLKARSAKRAVAADAERDVRLAVFARDGHRCVLEGRVGWGPCVGGLTVHHLRKASAGGGYEAGNLLSLCARMNDLVEDRPVEAHALGLVVRAGETVESAWDRMRAAGLLQRRDRP